MTNNPVRKALLDREITIGTWIQIGHPVSAEVLANAGYDWIAADMEHTDIGIETFTSLARAMYGRGPIPMARVRENDTLAIRQVLDAGAMGVIVPLVNSPEEAEQAVAAAKYAPRGVRGFSFVRANNYGEDFDDYVRCANDDIAVVVMIESKDAVENIDRILEVEGVDGTFLGPYDMSGSYGVPGQTSHPDVVDACRRVVEACGRHSKSAGLHVLELSPEAIETAIADGFTFIGLGIDTVFLQQASKAAIEAARCAIS